MCPGPATTSSGTISVPEGSRKTPPGMGTSISLDGIIGCCAHHHLGRRGASELQLVGDQTCSHLHQQCPRRSETYDPLDPVPAGGRAVNGVIGTEDLGAETPQSPPYLVGGKSSEPVAHTGQRVSRPGKLNDGIPDYLRQESQRHPVGVLRGAAPSNSQEMTERTLRMSRLVGQRIRFARGPLQCPGRFG